jgi:hypothetical protein
MATREEVLESNEAELILKSDVFKKSIDNLKEEYVALWMKVKIMLPLEKPCIMRLIFYQKWRGIYAFW